MELFYRLKIIESFQLCLSKGAQSSYWARPKWDPGSARPNNVLGAPRLYPINLGVVEASDKCSGFG
jgi:hypothetical protein